MELSILGTGSSGNSYILQNSNTALIIDAGISFLEAKKAMDFNTQRIQGLLLSHSHFADHAKYVHEYLRNGINCYAHYDTWFETKHLNNPFAHQIYTHYSKESQKLQINRPFSLKEFLITPFLLVHDVTCLGFQITYPDTGNIIFMTDTNYSPFTFANVNHWIVECNYSEELLEKRAMEGKIDVTLMKRIKENHMSLETLITMFKANDLRYTNKIILIHGSDSNSDSKFFKRRVQEETGKEVFIAEKGIMTIITYDTFPKLLKASIDKSKTIIATKESYSFRIFHKGQTSELHILKIKQ
jgi:phosphoribosyl 1,2-cyclic phosphodiesterase